MFLNHVCIKTLSSAVFHFSFSARKPIRIFQKEMSDARDTFGPMIMHVFGMCTSVDTKKHLSRQLQGPVEKRNASILLTACIEDLWLFLRL
jgi:hypothetical protein